MEVKVYVRIAFHHLAEVLNDLQRVHHTKCVRQHESPDRLMVCDQRIHHLIDIVWRILHAVRPVFQIEIDTQSTLGGIGYLLLNVFNMFFGHLVQLMSAMLQRALCQQVDDPAATVGYPVNTLATIHKAQYFHTLQAPRLFCCTANHGHRFPLAF